LRIRDIEDLLSERGIIVVQEVPQRRVHLEWSARRAESRAK
jgi:hypothetical protein